MQPNPGKSAPFWQLRRPIKIHQHPARKLLDAMRLANCLGVEGKTRGGSWETGRGAGPPTATPTKTPQASRYHEETKTKKKEDISTIWLNVELDKTAKTAETMHRA